MSILNAVARRTCVFTTGTAQQIWKSIKILAAALLSFKSCLAPGTLAINIDLIIPGFQFIKLWRCSFSVTAEKEGVGRREDREEAEAFTQRLHQRPGAMASLTNKSLGVIRAHSLSCCR